MTANKNHDTATAGTRSNVKGQKASPPATYWHAGQWAEVIDGLPDWPVFDALRGDKATRDAVKSWWRELTGEDLDQAATFADLRIIPAEIARKHPDAAHTTLTHAEVLEFGQRHNLDAPEVIADRLREAAGLRAEEERDRILALFGGTDPVDLDASIGLPTFPVEVLPPIYASFVRAVAARFDVDPALPGSLVLGALGVALAGCVEVVPLPGWTEPLTPAIHAIADPGSFKSPILKMAFTPIYTAQNSLRQQRGGIDGFDADIEREAAKRRAKDAKEMLVASRIAGVPESDPVVTADDGFDVPTALSEVYALAQAVEGEDEQGWRIITTDATAEAIAALLARNNERIALVSAEGGILGTLGGRYSGGQANIDIVLCGYSGDPVVVDRKSGEPIYLERPSVSQVLAYQSEVLGELMKRGDMIARGLGSRIEFVLVGPSGQTLHGHLGPVIPTPVIVDYESHLHALTVAMRQEAEETPTVTFNDAAMDQFSELRATTLRRAQPGGDCHGTTVMEEWIQKHPGRISREAAYLHFAQHGMDGLTQPIDALTLSNAEKLGDFYLEHSRAAFDAPRGGTATVSEMRAALKYLHACRAEGQAMVPTGQFSKCGPKALRSASERDRVLDALANYHHVVCCKADVLGGKAILLHPKSGNPSA